MHATFARNKRSYLKGEVNLPMTKIALAVCLAIASVSTLTAQTNGTWEKVYMALMAQDMQNARGYANVGFTPAIISIPNNPFTATRTYSDQRMKDGQNVGDPITAEWTIARDDKGRVHYEMVVESVENGKLVIGAFDVQIYDPVAHTWIRYFTKPDHSLPADPVAQIRKLKLMSQLEKPAPPPPPKAQVTNEDSDENKNDSPRGADQPPNATNKAPAPPPIKFLKTKDNLPTQYVNGYAAVIHRTILKYGDKQQYFQIQEDWLSPDYAIDLRRLLLRETINKETIETKDIVQGAPDPALFEVPSGYKMHIEK